ncbi:MAG: molybdopterin molybdotransferase MoeA [Desulfosarcina sp.]|nr:molybdopterin molybdotransferase MoeA [Desulfobacterales bacterium]
MTQKLLMGLDEALQLTLGAIRPLDSETVALPDSVDRAVACDQTARVDSPSVDASLKDGYAVVSGDVASASESHPVPLKLAGCMAAGGEQDVRVATGTTVQVLTGPRIPSGADAVVAEEFVPVAGDDILVGITAEPGRNILAKGTDVALGKTIARRGQRLSPGMVGILAAAGHSHIEVVGKPFVAIVATGDEVVAPGQPLPEGKLYASNISTLGAWCRRYHLQTRLALVKDDPEALLDTLKTQAADADALITSGGAWTGDRDLVAQTLARLGWRQMFHRIRIGPGKAVGFGLLEDKPVFILPGGPPSNLMGFLQIALPGLLKLAGYQRPQLPTMSVELAFELNGRHADWTQFVFGRIEGHPDRPVFHHLDNASRLRSMAEAGAVVAIPEGQTVLPAGSQVVAQLLG